jgi:chemotaxis signal transduction protein
MSSAEQRARWLPGAGASWPTNEQVAPISIWKGSISEPRPPDDCAGQISEHLAYYTRRGASARAQPISDQPRASGPLPDKSSASSPATSFMPPDIDLLLSAEEQRATMLYEQKMVEPPRGTPFLTFKLNDLRWGVPVVYLREILPSIASTTPLPFSPIWLYGLMNLRGEPVGLVNLSDLLLDPVMAANVRRRIGAGAPVIIAENEGVPLALLVEELGEVAFIEDHQLEKLSTAEIRVLPAFAVAHLQAAWAPTETAQPVLLLDLPRLLTSLLQQLTSEEAQDD